MQNVALLYVHCFYFSRKTLEEKFIQLCDNFSDAKKFYFEGIFPQSSYEPGFLITREFKKLNEHLGTAKRKFLIRGPKGVGKSMALAAIATLYHKKRPCFLWSPRATEMESVYWDYLCDLCREFGKQPLLVFLGYSYMH